MANDHRWVFPEGQGGTTADWIGQAPGTLGSDVTWVPGGRYGLGDAVAMAPTPNAYIDFGMAVGQFGTDVFTVMLWFQTSDNNPLFDLCGNRNTASEGNFFDIRLSGSNGTVIAEVCEGDGSNYIGLNSTGPALNDGQWHHVAVVRAGPTLSLYIDGESNTVGIAADVANISNAVTFRLGQGFIFDVAGAVTYSDLCVFNDQMTADEIRHIFHFH